MSWKTAWLLHLESFAVYFQVWYMGQFRNLVKTMIDFSCDCFYSGFNASIISFKSFTVF